MTPAPLKRVSTLFLKAIIVVIGAIVLALCVFLLPQIWIMVPRELPEFMPMVYPALIGLSASAIPFYVALFQAFKLLHSIDKNTAFSESSVQALRNITYCAVAISVCYAAGMPLAFTFADLDDSPGVVVIAAAIVCAPLIVATFAAVLQKLVQSAIDLKTENDLTV